jgi:hypothetical protein
MEVIVGPFVTWFSAVLGHPTVFPTLNSPLLESTLAGMLGLGYAARSFEKYHNVAGNH